MSISRSAAVWTASTDRALALRVVEVLDTRERKRAERISHPGERRRFIASRVLLRHAISKASGGELPPDQWHFREDAQGKPFVASGLPDIPFNIAHADDCVAVAVGSAGPVGVDIEGLWRDERRNIVEDSLAPGERVMLDTLESDMQWRIFIRIWTLKEACAKAAGLGMGVDFASLEVAFDPLRVVRSGALLPYGSVFDVAEMEIGAAGRRYHLCVAAVAGTQGATEFLFRTTPVLSAN